MKIVIIGAGSFGTAIAQQLAANTDNDIVLLFRDKERANIFKQTRINKKYFPNIQLASTINGTSDWKVISDADIVFIAIPAKNVEQVIKEIRQHLNQKTLLVNLVKGIYEENKTIVDFLIAELQHENIVTLKGPSFSVEMMNRQATLLTLGFSLRSQLKLMKKITEATNIFLDYTTDIRGVELLSGLKNIYAILLGSIDARYNAANTRFLVMTRAFSEIELILEYLGGRKDTLSLGCGIGDINLTALTDLSRNRTLGLLIGKGFYNPSYETNSVVLEGVKTLEMIHAGIPTHLRNSLPLLERMISFFIEKNQSALELDFGVLFEKRYKTVLTYGTFDLLHFGHLEILRRAKNMGDRLIVGLSTDKFNEIKGKKCKFPYEKRKMFLESLSYVDLVIPEDNWEQKSHDVSEYGADIFVMGDDWKGKFDFLKEECEVFYLARTKGVSTTKLKKLFSK